MVERKCDMSTVVTIIISLVALFFSAASYYHSIAKPDLYLKYYVYGEEKIYTNGSGAIILQELTDKSWPNYLEPFDNTEKQVDYCRPHTEVGFSIVNTGRAVAKNPTIVLQFYGIEVTESMDQQLQDNFKYVEKSNHVHGLGYYSRYQWMPMENESLYTDIEKIFSLISFSECFVSEGAYIEVSIAADATETKTFKIPVEVKQVY